MHRIEATIAGIGIPDSPLAREATEFVREVSTRLPFDHSRRVFLFSRYSARVSPSAKRPISCSSHGEQPTVDWPRHARNSA
jgi:hypothetical protein